MHTLAPPPVAAPSDFRCQITGGPTPLSVTGIPGAQAGTWLLQTVGLRANWHPDSDTTTTPYAFVALGFWVHVAWFPAAVTVPPEHPTACGDRFSLQREPLLPRPVAPATVGCCSGCLTAWNQHYG
ncbi:hypothetical protein [Actinopolyspora halophila]|uniref:hypothetical protein n=1 Tax=Actinopolyspora halophila TaxID=1850 RepID=UPI0003782676|nr:hypothetical protein [Actinopolyspora halophila]